jgi:methyl-accepting chemotaxis protein
MEATISRHKPAISYLLIISSCALGVWLLRAEFHSLLQSIFSLATREIDALGTIILVSTAFAAQHLASRTLLDTTSHHTAQEECTNLKNACSATVGVVAGELQQFTPYHGVLREQLAGVTTQTEQAAFDITQRLQVIDGVVERLSSLVASSSDKSSNLLAESQQRIEHNRDLLTSIEDYIRQRIERTETDRLRVEQTVQEIQSLDTLVQLVRNISSQTNLLALNAAIEAARAGEAGRGFAVVADEVRKLSSGTDQAVASINEGIQGVSRSIQAHFESELSAAHIEAEQSTLKRLAKQLDDMGGSYRELIEHETQLMSQIHSSSQQLSQMFMDAMASVQFQDAVRQQIELICAALERLDRHAEVLGKRLEQFDSTEPPQNDFQPLSSQLEDLYSSYVMSSQRQSHAHALGQADSPLAAGSGPRVELF